MGNSSSKQKITSKDKAILELKIQRDKLKQYEKKIQLVIEKELQVAKEQLTKKNHHAARLALSKKKYQEQLLEKTGNQLMTIENLTQTIEYALVEQQIIEKLALGASVLKEIHKEMDLSKVDKIMDDTAEGIAYQKEIEEAMMAGGVGGLSEEDQEEIMGQLDALIEEEGRMKAGSGERDALRNLPEVPKNDIIDLTAGSKSLLPNMPDVPLTEPQAKGTAISPIAEDDRNLIPA